MRKKSFILLLVTGVVFIVIILGTGILLVTSNQARIAQKKIRRMRAFFAAKAAIVDARARLRIGNITTNTTYDHTVDIPGESGYPITVNVTIGNIGENAPVGTRYINATVEY